MTDRTTQGDAKRLLAELRSDLYEAAPAPLAPADRELREIKERHEEDSRYLSDPSAPACSSTWTRKLHADRGRLIEMCEELERDLELEQSSRKRLLNESIEADCDNHVKIDCLTAELSELQSDLRDTELRLDDIEAERDRLTASNAELQAVTEGLLRSADCAWEERNEGHDWRGACMEARTVLGWCGKIWPTATREEPTGPTTTEERYHVRRARQLEDYAESVRAITTHQLLEGSETEEPKP